MDSINANNGGSPIVQSASNTSHTAYISGFTGIFPRDSCVRTQAGEKKREVVEKKKSRKRRAKKMMDGGMRWRKDGAFPRRKLV